MAKVFQPLAFSLVFSGTANAGCMARSFKNSAGHPPRWTATQFPAWPAFTTISNNRES